MNLQPLNDRVILKLEKAEEITSGGIVLPQNAQEQTHLGKVIAVGPGRKTDTGDLIKPEVSTGDLVVISGKWVGENVTVDGEEYKIVSASDILAIVKK
ncbi:MAG: co-chaperone GroES [Niabella sp.]|nr:MAG: co-chaperone GroES [Niabella sp.]